VNKTITDEIASVNKALDADIATVNRSLTDSITQVDNQPPIRLRKSTPPSTWRLPGSAKRWPTAMPH
jgi:hypothetical protein